MTQTQPHSHHNNPENRQERQALLASSIDQLSRGPQTALSAHWISLARQEVQALQSGYESRFPQFSLRLDMIKMLYDPRIVRDFLSNDRDRFDALQQGLLQDILSDMARFPDSHPNTPEIRQEVLDLLADTESEFIDKT